MKEFIRVVVVEPYKKAYILDKFKNTEENFKAFLGKDYRVKSYFLDDSLFFCSNRSQTPNRAIRDKDGNIEDIVCGTFLIVWNCGIGRRKIGSLPKQYAEKYVKLFKEAELYRRLPNGKVLMQKVEV